MTIIDACFNFGQHGLEGQWDLKLIRIKLMRVNLPSVNAALPVIFL